ncbi:MAG: hypothetical protein WC498_04005 [Candidatus Saccharimonadales bacterium]
MAVAEIYAGTIDTGEAVLDLSHQLWQLARPEKAYGAAFVTTLGKLGLACELLPTDYEPRLQIKGSVDTIYDYLPTFSDEVITGVAKESALTEASFRPVNEIEVTGLLRRLTTKTLPQLDRNISLANMSLLLAIPFASHVTGTGIIGHAECKAPWSASGAERELQKFKEGLTGRTHCIPVQPHESPEETLARLQADLAGEMPAIHAEQDALLGTHILLRQTA